MYAELCVMAFWMSPVSATNRTFGKALPRSSYPDTRMLLRSVEQSGCILLLIRLSHCLLNWRSILLSISLLESDGPNPVFL